jgi:hypothetical protein
MVFTTAIDAANLGCLSTVPKFVVTSTSTAFGFTVLGAVFWLETYIAKTGVFGVHILFKISLGSRVVIVGLGLGEKFGDWWGRVKGKEEEGPKSVFCGRLYHRGFRPDCSFDEFMDVRDGHVGIVAPAHNLGREGVGLFAFNCPVRWGGIIKDAFEGLRVGGFDDKGVGVFDCDNFCGVSKLAFDVLGQGGSSGWFGEESEHHSSMGEWDYGFLD